MGTNDSETLFDCKQGHLIHTDRSGATHPRYGTPHSSGRVAGRSIRADAQTLGGRGQMAAPPSRATSAARRGPIEAPVNFIVCKFGDLGSILSRSNDVKPEKYGDFRRNDRPPLTPV